MKKWNGIINRENNLNILRFFAALLVIFSHAYVLTTNETDPIAKATRGQTTGGQLAVLLFFFFGGLLIMKSMESKKTAKAFFSARVKRIFPPLWIVVLLCAFALGPILSTLSFPDYIRNGGTWKYLLNGLLIPIHPLPGVFEGNIYGPAVNGSLWTLPVEFACYILCWLFYRLGLTEPRKALICTPLVIAAAAGGWILTRNNPVLQSAVLPVLFFYLGMICYLFRTRIPMNGALALAAAALLVLSVFCGVFTAALCIFYPYILLYLGFGTRVKLSGFGQKLELSYAIYLTAFPAQQTLVQFHPGMSPLVHFLLASCIAAAVSVPVTLLDKKINGFLNGRRKTAAGRQA